MLRRVVSRSASAARRSAARRSQVAWFSDDAPKASEETPVVEDELAITPKVQKVVDQILELNMVEIMELSTAIQQKFNLPDVSAMGAMGGGGGGAPAEEAPKEEKTQFDVKLASFDAKSKIKVIKEVRAITGLGLKEAKELVENVPGVLKKDMKKEEADEIVAKLAEVGAVVELE